MRILVRAGGFRSGSGGTRCARVASVWGGTVNTVVIASCTMLMGGACRSIRCGGWRALGGWARLGARFCRAGAYGGDHVSNQLPLRRRTYLRRLRQIRLNLEPLVCVLLVVCALGGLLTQ
jgi:hypothetical protein